MQFETCPSLNVEIKHQKSKIIYKEYQIPISFGRWALFWTPVVGGFPFPLRILKLLRNVKIYFERWALFWTPIVGGCRQSVADEICRPVTYIRYLYQIYDYTYTYTYIYIHILVEIRSWRDRNLKSPTSGSQFGGQILNSDPASS
jgi:hypothetical protein